MCMSVDLPDPDGPMIATNSFSPMSSVTPANASMVTPPMTYVLRRSVS